jgi:hypothetical protein
MAKRQSNRADIEKLLRRLPSRQELVRRLALLYLPGPHHADKAFDQRIDELRRQLQPHPTETARILAEAAKIGRAMLEPADE